MGKTVTDWKEKLRPTWSHAPSSRARHEPYSRKFMRRKRAAR